MLSSIRTAASNWLGRVVLTVIMGLLIVSFAIWGIGDIFKGGVSRNVATVGDTNITADQFRTSFNEELRRLQQRARRAITTDEARAFGLDRELLERSINEAALNQKAKALGLAIDGASITNSIIEADVFKTAGQFDRNRFSDLLQQNGMSEAQFIAKQGELLVRQQLDNALMGGFSASDSLLRAVHQFRNEERSVDFITVQPEKATQPSAPDEAALRAFHEERKSEFRTVETRKVTLIRTSPEQFSGNVTITDADLKAFYDKGVLEGRYGTPERRQALRILFETETEAKAAADKLAAGTTIEAILAERKLAEKDVDLGLKHRGEIADAALATAVFSTALNATSAPVKDPFGFVLVHVKAIEAAKATPFEEVKPRILTEARTDKIALDPTIKAAMDDLFKKIEDQRIAGKSLSEAAKEAKIEPLVIEALDRAMGDGKGGRIALPGGQDIVTAIFASDIGLDNEPVQQRDGGYVWFEVNGVDPARDKSFEEVKADVEARFLADRRGKATAEFTTTLIKKMESGATLAAIAAELGQSVQNVAAAKRNTREAVLGAEGVERAFSGPIGKAVSAVAPDGVGRLILLPKATALLPYDKAADERSGIIKQVGLGMSEDLLGQYLAAIKAELGVTKNQRLIDQALGQTN